MLKTIDDRLLDIEELSWEEAAQILSKSSPGLVDVINDLPKELRYPFYKVCYRFGEQIVDKDGLHLPLNNGGTVLVSDQCVPETLKKNLGCATGISCPIGVISNKKCEFYLQHEEKITPYMILKPGEVFGISKNMGENDEPVTCFWDLVAGARSLFMLSKISNNPQHTHLKRKYELSSRAPTNYSTHWLTFKEIALKADSTWRAEILFFDDRWADALKDIKYAALKSQILSANPSEIWHHQPSWDIAFGKIEAARNLSAYPVDILDAARHLFNVVAGLFPGFVPATDEMFAPIKLLQEAYTNIYELEHAPIIMEPAVMSISYKLPVYYSLNWATSPKSIPKTMDNKKSVVFNLSILMEIIRDYQDDLTQKSRITSSLKLRTRSLWQAASRAKFSFYDNEYKTYKGIKDVATLPSEDSRFACEGKTFPVHSAFLKGLIKISTKGF